MNDHARLSPSKSARWLACPGSVREEARYPDTSGAAAVDGTRTHLVLENCIEILKITKSMPDPLGFVGTDYVCLGERFKLDRERALRVKVATEYIAQRVDEFGGLDKCHVMAEKRVSLGPILGRADLDGTCDVQIHVPNQQFLEVIDYKDGMGVVEVKDNPQLELYALGAMFNSVQHVRMTIVQPKLALKGMPPITSVDVSAEYLRTTAAQKFIEGAKRTDDPNAPLSAGEHCKFCKHKGACSEYSKQVMQEVGVMFAPVEVAQQSAEKDPTSMSNDELRQLVESAPAMRQLLEAAEAESLRRMKGGQQIPGLKVVYGRGTRSWALPEDEMADKLIKMGIPKGVIYETKLVSPAKAEKLQWEKKSRAGEVEKKQLSDRQLKTLEVEYIKKSQGRLTVAPASDHREAVVFDASPMFAPVEPAVPDWMTLPDWMN